MYSLISIRLELDVLIPALGHTMVLAYSRQRVDAAECHGVYLIQMASVVYEAVFA
jgi:hypothetical protein